MNSKFFLTPLIQYHFSKGDGGIAVNFDEPCSPLYEENVFQAKIHHDIGLNTAYQRPRVRLVFLMTYFMHKPNEKGAPHDH